MGLLLKLVRAAAEPHAVGQTMTGYDPQDRPDAIVLTVRDSVGGVVANVRAAPDCPFATNPGEPPGFVIGSYTPGPEFAPIGEMLAKFRAIYSLDDTDAAIAAHNEINALNLSATDALGNVYCVFNVYFQSGGLLFAAVRR